MHEFNVAIGKMSGHKTTPCNCLTFENINLFWSFTMLAKLQYNLDMIMPSLQDSEVHLWNRADNKDRKQTGSKYKLSAYKFQLQGGISNCERTPVLDVCQKRHYTSNMLIAKRMGLYQSHPIVITEGRKMICTCHHRLPQAPVSQS